MIRLNHFLLGTLFVCLFSCKNKQEKFYATKEFRKSLQPFLYKVVSEGIVTYHDSSDIKGISDDELSRLFKSENPILRATALRKCLIEIHLILLT
jgi:hypothetical protein